MAFELHSVETDTQAEVTGVWTEKLQGDMQLLVARVGNKKYLAFLRAMTKDTTAELTEEQAESLTLSCYANTILLGWEGVQENGKQLDYSVQEAERILRKYPEFFKIVQREATKLANFHVSRTNALAAK